MSAEILTLAKELRAAHAPEHLCARVEALANTFQPKKKPNAEKLERRLLGRIWYALRQEEGVSAEDAKDELVELDCGFSYREIDSMLNGRAGTPFREAWKAKRAERADWPSRAVIETQLRARFCSIGFAG
jgi:hypothetical protein